MIEPLDSEYKEIEKVNLDEKEESKNTEPEKTPTKFISLNRASDFFKESQLPKLSYSNISIKLREIDPTYQSPEKLIQDKFGFIFDPFTSLIIIVDPGNSNKINALELDQYVIFQKNWFEPDTFFRNDHNLNDEFEEIGSIFKKQYELYIPSLLRKINGVVKEITESRTLIFNSKEEMNFFLEGYRQWRKFLGVLYYVEENYEKIEKEKIINELNQEFDMLNQFFDQSKNYLDELKLVLNRQESIIIEREKEFKTNHFQDILRGINYLETNLTSFKEGISPIESKIKYSKSVDDFLNVSNRKEFILTQKKFISTISTISFGILEMINCLVNNNRLRYYEIYENFDKIRIFNSQHQTDVIQSLNSIDKKIDNLGEKLDKLNSAIDNMSKEVISSINTLGYNINKLDKNLTSQLGSISSSLKFNNILTSIQTYQLYKINKQTK